MWLCRRDQLSTRSPAQRSTAWMDPLGRPLAQGQAGARPLAGRPAPWAIARVAGPASLQGLRSFSQGSAPRLSAGLTTLQHANGSVSCFSQAEAIELFYTECGASALQWKLSQAQSGPLSGADIPNSPAVFRFSDAKSLTYGNKDT